MNPCAPVGMGFFSRAPHLFIAERDLRASPDRIFTSFENAADWTLWVPVIRRVTWSCEMPYRVGSTRTVHMLGGLTADEVFIA